MANSKILAKITMLSAGSAAPYDSAVVGLTTWDQDLVVGGVTYLKGRIVALAKAAASSGDASSPNPVIAPLFMSRDFQP